MLNQIYPVPMSKCRNSENGIELLKLAGTGIASYYDINGLDIPVHPHGRLILIYPTRKSNY